MKFIISQFMHSDNVLDICMYIHGLICMYHAGLGKTLAKYGFYPQNYVIIY